MSVMILEDVGCILRDLMERCNWSKKECQLFQANLIKYLNIHSYVYIYIFYVCVHKFIVSFVIFIYI